MADETYELNDDERDYARELIASIEQSIVVPGLDPANNAVLLSVELIDRIGKAIAIGIGLGQFDGGHHKQWVIDQIIRTLAGDKYDEIIAEAFPPFDPSEPDAEWDTGIAP